MPKFFFDTADGRAFHDPDGTNLADFAAAQLEAVQILCQLLPGHEMKALGEDGFVVTVSDAQRQPLMKLSVAIDILDRQG